jgi:hypothetical protein
MSFKAEVTTAGDGGEYTANGLRFAARGEAEAYAFDLACRWTAVEDWRVVEAPEAVNSWWDGRKAVPLDR